MLISPSVTEIQLFKWLTLKKFKVMGEVKVKGHNVSLTSYRLTSLWFHVNWPSHSWNTAFSKFDLENSRSRSHLKVTKKVYHPINSYPFRSMSIGPPIPGIQLFQNLTLKIQGQGHGWGQSHNMGPTFSQLTSLSFHANRASNSWVTTFPKFDLENQGSRSWVRSKLKVTTWVQHSIDSHPIRLMWIRHPIPELQHFQNLTLKIKGQRSWVRSQFKVTMCV